MTGQGRGAIGPTAGPGYAEYAVVTGRVAFVAGQCPLDDAGAVVGGADVGVQTAQVAANLRLRLAELGAGPDAVVRTTVYVVGDDAALSAAWSVLRDSGATGDPMAPSTLLGVTRLGHPGQLVEIDAIVALGDAAGAAGGAA
jgi:enamine deaminase RidA (YjgF/YER057c/UK114 family)